MKKVLLIITACLLLFSAWGCMSPEEKETQNQIMAYLDNMAVIEEEKSKVTDSALIVENSDDEEEILTLITDDMLPTAEAISQSLGEIEVSDQQLKVVHQHFVDGWAQFTQGLVEMRDGLQEKDLDKAEAGSVAVQASQDKLNLYYQELTTLCTEHNIKLETEIPQDNVNTES